MVPCGPVRTLPYVIGKWTPKNDKHAWEVLPMLCDGRCFFHCIVASEFGFPRWTNLDMETKIRHAKNTAELLHAALPKAAYDNYVLGRSFEEQHLEPAAFALNLFLRIHVDTEADATFVYGPPTGRHIDILHCLRNGAEHFDLLRPQRSQGLPKALKIKEDYFAQIITNQKRVEFRRDDQKLRKMLQGEDFLCLQMGYQTDGPYCIVQLDRVAWDMPAEDTLRNWGIANVSYTGRLAFLYIRSVEEVWYPKTLGQLRWEVLGGRSLGGRL